MQKINLYCVGNLKDKPFVDMCNEYSKRISRFAKLTIVEVKEKNELNLPELIAKEETSQILSKVSPENIVLFDVKGKSFSSEEFAVFLDKYFQTSSEINFVIGGSYGVSEELKSGCKQKISVSNMTFPHRLFRVMALEQIYRALTILNNISYHK